MSRSYKKNPVYKPPASKLTKRVANKKVRKSKDLLGGKGNDYKKIFESWNIRDWRIWQDLSPYIVDRELFFDSKDLVLQRWKKYYRRK